MLSHSSLMAVWSCWILAGTGTLSASRICVQILAPWGCALSCWNMMWLAADEWHDNGPQDLIKVSLCIQIAIDKMQLCSLYVAYACPYHNPTATMGNSVHNVDMTKPLATKRHTLGLRLWGQLVVLPNSLKLCWRRLMVEKLTFHFLATALVDIPAVSKPIAHSLKTWDVCGIVLCNTTVHFRVDFYCPPHKVHLCNDHVV